MSHDEISFEKLNAYVDGELDSIEAAEVARAVADDIHLANQVSALSRLRSAIAEGIETPPQKMPKKKEPGRYRAVLAASITFLMFVAGSVFMSTLDRDFREGWLPHAWQIHGNWSLQQAAAETPMDPVLARYGDAVPGAYVPDLSASKLSVALTAVHEFSGNRSALLVGYRGTRGCKISLITFTRPLSLDKSLRYYRQGTNEAYAWKAGKLGYVILSDGMDPRRFKILAESVRQSSRLHLPFDKKTYLALQKSREESAPCLA